jgi:3-hydroxyacyl-CoA dehydrogenase
MMDPVRTVRRAAVLGAGVMGSQIAAHLANAGVRVDCFEIAGRDDSDPRGAARRGVEGLAKLKPAPLASKAAQRLVQPASYDIDLDRLAGCDLVVEAVAERPAIKAALYERVAPAMGAETLFVTNTSGLSIERLAANLPPDLRGRFCGVHFFNPPRYMHLVELIPHGGTDGEALYRLEGYLTTGLGKGVLHARDTPGFIGNRIGVFALANTIHHGERLGLPLDLVDRLTGQGVGRPKSATLRTADIVGLDTFVHVVDHLHESLPDDPWREIFRVPDWVRGRVDAGALGQKTGVGIYRKGEDGIQVLDPASGDYRRVQRQLDERVRTALDETDPERKYEQLAAIDHPQAELIRASLRDLFHYCAHHLADIAPSARELDLAVRWGFGWQLGPLEMWQQLGWQRIGQALTTAIDGGETTAGVALPEWAVDAERTGVHGAAGSWAADGANWLPRSSHPVYRRQLRPPRLTGEPEPQANVLWSNAGVSLWNDADDVAVLSLRTRMHTIDGDVLEGIERALEVAAQQQARAVVLWQPEPPFSVGANLKGVAAARDRGDYDSIEALVAAFQRATGAIRDAPLPVVGAPQGMALGGGTELLLACDARVLALETYMGLVEAGVGLIPAGGGCAALARRAWAASADGDPMPWLQRYFEEIAYGRVSASAAEAGERGWLTAADRVVSHPDEVLAAAKREAVALADAGYRPAPAPAALPVAGASGVATLEAKLVNLYAGGFISDHDYRIGRYLAEALCGGPVDAGVAVSESWLLAQERAGFMALARTEHTGERIRHMLQTGKPLRN